MQKRPAHAVLTRSSCQSEREGRAKEPSDEIYSTKGPERATSKVFCNRSNHSKTDANKHERTTSKLIGQATDKGGSNGCAYKGCHGNKVLGGSEVKRTSGVEGILKVNA
jgi:hypothetical protein